MKRHVLIVAGGSGSRMGTATPKQFLEIANKAIILRSIDCFLNAVPDATLTLVIAARDLHYWQAVSQQAPYNKIAIAMGGETRFHSVKNGLDLIKEEGIVAIHDAVRPFASKETILTAFEAAEQFGAAVPVIQLTDSLRQVNGDKSEVLDRSHFRLVQTPQCFRLDLIKEAYQSPYLPSYTDDASVLEHSGFAIQLVEGNIENIKITSPLDLQLAEILAQKA